MKGLIAKCTDLKKKIEDLGFSFLGDIFFFYWSYLSCWQQVICMNFNLFGAVKYVSN